MSGFLRGAFDLAHNAAASLFWFVLVVGILVFLHEAGHFLTAKLFGMRVDVFSLGFGKRLFGRKRGDTDYRVSLIPLGGYVKLAGGEEMGEVGIPGMDGSPAEPVPAERPVEPLPPDYFLSRPRWQRFLVLVMGAVVNLVLAVALFSVSFMLGVEMPEMSRPVVHVVEPGTPAARAGLQAGDRITKVNGEKASGWIDIRTGLIKGGKHDLVLEVKRGSEDLTLTLTPTFDRSGVPDIGARGNEPAIVSNVDPNLPGAKAGLREDDRIEAIDGKPVEDYTEVAEIIRASEGKELVLTVRRGDRTLELRATPVKAKVQGKDTVRLGFQFKTPVIKLPPLEAVARGFETARDQAAILFVVFKNLLTRNQPLSTLSGPIEIARASRAFAQRGVPLLFWMAFISLQLGILNLLPIPVLDGGHIFILLTEGVLRRDLSIRFKERLNQVGFIFLVALMAAVLLQDILKLIPVSP